MRSLSHLFQEKKSAKLPAPHSDPSPLDAKTVFFLFERIIRDYYGQRGGGVIHPSHFDQGVLFITVASPLWANELLIQERVLCERLNAALGSEVVRALKVEHGLSSDGRRRTQ